MAINVNFLRYVIEITDATSVTCQELINEIRPAEDSWVGISYPKVADAAGKAALGVGKETGITLFLYDPWQIQFSAGVGVAYVTDGNVVTELGGSPIMPTGSDDTIVVVGAVASTIVTAGSGVTEVDIEDIADAVWDEASADHTSTGSTGEKIDKIKKDTTLIPGIL